MPQGLKAKKLARLMSGLKPGPTQLGGFSASLLSRALIENMSFSAVSTTRWRLVAGGQLT